MRFSGNLIGITRRQVTALALLCLIAHAFVVGVTHHHRSDAPPSQQLISHAGDSNRSPELPIGQDCPSCCLQGVCASVAAPPAFVLTWLPAILPDRPLAALRRLSVPCLIRSSRAPPLM